MPNIIRIASLFCLSLLLSSCGFALRGSERPALPPGSDTVFLRSAQENSPLSQSVQTALQAQQLRLVADASEAAYVLQIGPEEFDSQAATVNGRATAAQYRYLLSAEVSLSQNGVTLLVDPMSYQYLVGAEIDYTEGLEGSQFVIKNPNASTTCGCGSSFSV